MGSCRQSFVKVLLSFSIFPLQHRTTDLEAQSFPRTIPGNQITLAAIRSKQKVSPFKNLAAFLVRNGTSIGVLEFPATDDQGHSQMILRV